jgi:hypothetical protein
MTTFLSPAFLQQCFAMHRYDLVVKRITQSGVVVTCRACKIRHAVRLQGWEREAESVGAPRPAIEEPLVACAMDHLAAVGLQAVDVQRDFMEVACRQCRTAQPVRILECVTRSLVESSGL